MLFLQYALFLSILCDQMWTICIIMYLLVFRYTYLHICIYIYIYRAYVRYSLTTTRLHPTFSQFRQATSLGALWCSKLLGEEILERQMDAIPMFEILLVGGLEHLDSKYCWLVVWNIWIRNIAGWWCGTFGLFFHIGNSNPNWRTHIFQRGSNHQPGGCDHHVRTSPVFL